MRWNHWVLLGFSVLFLLSCEVPSETALQEAAREYLTKLYDLDGDIRMFCPDFPCSAGCSQTDCTVTFKVKGDPVIKERRYDVYWCTSTGKNIRFWDR